MKRQTRHLLVLLLMCIIMTSCANTSVANTEPKNTTNTNRTIPTTTALSSEIGSLNTTEIYTTDLNGEESPTPITDDDTPISSDTLVPEIVDYNTQYTEFRRLGLSVTADIIPLPSTQKPSENILQEFDTAEEFQQCLATYSDLLDHSKDTLEIRNDGFLYQHGCSSYSYAGAQCRFFLVGSQQMPALYSVEIDDVMYDKETKSIYVMMFTKELKHSVYEDDAAIQQQLDNHSKTTYGIVYLYINNETAPEIEHIYFVTPEQSST